MPSRWKTSGLAGSRRARRRARASAMGGEMGRIRPTSVFERAGESRMTPPASSISSQVRPRSLLLAPAGVVGEVEDVLPRGGQVGADGEVFGVLEEALAGGILAEPVGEAGHGVEPAPVDGERAHAVEGRGLPVDGAGGRPGGAPGELVLADLVRGERGSPCGAAEESGEMGGPATGGALGSELPDLVVLEVGVAEIAQGRPLGAERARGRCRRAGGTGGGGRAGLVRGHGLGPSLVAAASRRRPSTFALVGATGKWNVRRRRDGDGTRGVHRDARATRRHRRGVSADTARGPETGVHDIRGTTRRRFAAKEKRRIVLEGLRGEERLAGVVAERGDNPKVYDRWRTAYAEAGKP